MRVVGLDEIENFDHTNRPVHVTNSGILLRRCVTLMDEAIENLVELVNVLRKAEKEIAKMTEEEKKDNAIKMHDDKGDIWY